MIANHQNFKNIEISSGIAENQRYDLLGILLKVEETLYI